MPVVVLCEGEVLAWPEDITTQCCCARQLMHSRQRRQPDSDPTQCCNVVTLSLARCLMEPTVHFPPASATVLQLTHALGLPVWPGPAAQRQP